MPADVRQCKECGKAYEVQMGESLCDVCLIQRDRILTQVEDAIRRTGKRGTRDIADITGLDAREVKRTMKSSHMLAHAGLSEDICSKCNSQNAQKGSRFCLQCRLELHKSLGDAAGTLLDDIHARRSRTLKEDLKRISPSDLLEDKRRRTGTHRFDPSPKQSKRYG